MNLSPRKRGIIHEEQCKLFFLERGYDISIPLGECSPYDFILDAHGCLLKIQCKKPNYKDGSLSFYTCKEAPNPNNLKSLHPIKYRETDVDYIAVLFNSQCYLVEYNQSLPYEMKLRIDLPRCRGKLSTIHWAYEYEADYILERRFHPESTLLRSGWDLCDVDILDNQKDQRVFYWITNGVTNRRITDGSELPEGFWIGRSGKTNQFT